MMGGLVSVLTGHIVELMKLRAYAAALYAGAAASLLFAFTFALVALRTWIAVGFHSEYPDLWVALLMAIVAAILVGVGVYFQRQQPKTKPVADIALLAGPPAARLAFRRLNPKTVAVGVILIAGLALGRRMTTRA